jgi:hypothetical protein
MRAHTQRKYAIMTRFWIVRVKNTTMSSQQNIYKKKYIKARIKNLSILMEP